MSNKKVLNKIRKCLALSKSDNPGEAAAALRQAQKLMALHDVTEFDVELAEVVERKASAGTRADTPPQWLSLLARIVSEAFGVERFYDAKISRKSEYVFVGLSPNVELAEYAFTVLRRRCSSDRAAYYRKTRGKRANRIKRADAYAFGWSASVYSVVREFSKDVPKVVKQYLATYHALEEFKPRQSHNSKYRDEASKGFQDGKSVDLHHGMNGASQARLTQQ